jgi:hypothetical protein
MLQLTRETAGLLASDPGQFAGLPAERKSAYVLEKSPAAGWTVRHNGKYLLSRYDPEKEAERSASAARTAPSANFVFFGFGMGHFVRRILERSLPAEGDPRPVVLVLEENPEIAVRSLEARGMEILKRFETHLLLRPERLLDFDIDRSYIPLCFNPAVLTEIEFYRNAYGLMRLVSVNNSTKQKFRRLILRNSGRNIRQMSAAAPGRPVAGTAGVVVAAGPSLEQDLRDLRKVRDRCVIASSDTALPLLLESGIRPHFVVTGDPQVISYSHFYLCRKLLRGPDPVCLVSDVTASPLVMPLFGKNHVQINTGSPLSDMLPERQPLIRMGGSITAGAFFFLLGLGIRKVFFTGQDYGGLFDQTHCRGTIYDHYLLRMNSRLMTANSRQVRMHFPGSVRQETGAGPVWTTPLLVSYREWLKSEIERLDDVEVVNTSPRSLFLSPRIRGGSLKELEAAAPVVFGPPAGGPDPAGLPGAFAKLLADIRDAAGKLDLIARTTPQSASRRTALLDAYRSRDCLSSLFLWFYKGRERYFDLDRYGPERFDENFRLLLGLCRDLA